MAYAPRNKTQDMPVAARLVALAFGVFLIVASAGFFLAIRPLSWDKISIGVGAAGLGGDLLAGGIRGRWPASALLWLVP